jgi:hypothetical protein
MTIPSGRGRNGDLSITIILLKSESTLHLSKCFLQEVAEEPSPRVACSPVGDTFLSTQRKKKEVEGRAIHLLFLLSVKTGQRSGGESARAAFSIDDPDGCPAAKVDRCERQPTLWAVSQEEDRRVGSRYHMR